MSIRFVQSPPGRHWTSSPEPMAGLKLTIPRGAGDQALVILNVPNPYAEGEASGFPGGAFSLMMSGATLPAYASFTYSEQKPKNQARVPTTLTVAVALDNREQEITAMWQGLGGSIVVIDSPASLSVIIA